MPRGQPNPGKLTLCLASPQRHCASVCMPVRVQLKCRRCRRCSNRPLCTAPKQLPCTRRCEASSAFCCSCSLSHAAQNIAYMQQGGRDMQFNMQGGMRPFPQGQFVRAPSLAAIDFQPQTTDLDAPSALAAWTTYGARHADGQSVCHDAGAGSWPRRWQHVRPTQRANVRASGRRCTARRHISNWGRTPHAESEQLPLR